MSKTPVRSPDVCENSLRVLIEPRPEFLPDGVVLGI